MGRRSERVWFRLTSTGATSFVLRYRVDRRQRVYTIGSSPEWTAVAARNEALGCARRFVKAQEPMGERIAVRSEPTFGDLVDGYLASEELTRLRPHTRRDYIRMCEKILRPGQWAYAVEVDSEARRRSSSRRDEEDALSGQPRTLAAEQDLLTSPVNRSCCKRILRRGSNPFTRSAGTAT